MEKKNIQGFTEFGETSKINESNLSQKSIDDLINLKNQLQFVSKFDIEIHDATEVIEKLHKMSWSEIEEWKEHIITNYRTTKLEDFVIQLIDKYCQK